jgi:transposase
MGDVRVMGVDEWALRKGQTYATILVDLEPHRIVDVLPDDQPATLTTWLRAPPTIQVLTRDRDDAFAKAFAAGAPTAQPVADRFHLLKNLRHVLERVFTRHGVGPAPTPSPALPDPAPPRDPPPPTAPSSRQQDRWRQIQALRQAGHSISAIARILGLDRATVRKYATASTCPTPPPRPATPHALAGWTDRLEALWQSGLHRGRALFRQLRTAGYAGSESAVRRWVRRRHPRPSAGATPPRSRTSPATRAWQCLQWPADWAPQTVHALTAALQDPTIREALTLAQLFRTLVKHRRADALEPWLRRAETSGLPEFRRCAAGIRRDLAAVRAALSLPWSQGPTEGFHHTMKRLKRLMYGRANFDLLRARILHAPA